MSYLPEFSSRFWAKRQIQSRAFSRLADRDAALNHDRLPLELSLRDNDLNYLATQTSDAQAVNSARATVLQWVLVVPALVLLSFISPMFIPDKPFGVFHLFSILIPILLLRIFFFGHDPWPAIRTTLIYPFAFVLLGVAVNHFLEQASREQVKTAARTLTALATVLLLVLRYAPIGPFAFGWRWLIASPSVPPSYFETRHQPLTGLRQMAIGLRGSSRPGRNRGSRLLTRLAHFLSVLVAILAVCGSLYLLNHDWQTWRVWDASAVDWVRLGRLLALDALGIGAVFAVLRSDSRAGVIFSRYLTYDGLSGTPGVWTPRFSSRARAHLLSSTIALLCGAAFLSNGLLVRPVGDSPIKSHDDLIKRDSHKERVMWANEDLSAPMGLDLSGYPEEGSARRRWQDSLVKLGLRDDSTFAAHFVPGETEIDWLALFNPYTAILYTVYQRLGSLCWLLFMASVITAPFVGTLLLIPLGYLHVAARVTNRFALRDERSTWYRYAMRVRRSEFVATSPGIQLDPRALPTVALRTHMFLGIEPESNIPILFDQELLNEHAYIVGDSGSGKTSLGLMPLLKYLMEDFDDA